MALKVAAEYIPSLSSAETHPRCQRGTGCEGKMKPMSITQSHIYNGVFRLLRCEYCNYPRWYRETAAWELLPEELEF